MDLDLEYDKAIEIMEEVKEKLKEKKKKIEDIASREELEDFYFVPRIRKANVFLIRANSLFSKKFLEK